MLWLWDVIYIDCLFPGWMLWLWDAIYIDCLFPWLDAVVVGCYLYRLLISLVGCCGCGMLFI